MFRHLIVTLLALSLPFSSMAQERRARNEVSIVALIITSGSETPVSISVTNTLQSLDSQTLTANAPNASEMRSILKRFTAAAIDSDIALVYYDGAVLQIAGREFVAPGGIQLKRPSDLLTRAIPLSALARATALASRGGAVLVHSTGQDIELIDGVTLVNSAPEPRDGTSPILFADENAAVSLASGLEAMAGSDGDIDLTETLTQLSEIDGVSFSALPTRAAWLRKTTVIAPVIVAPVAEPEVAAPEVAAPVTTNPVMEATDVAPEPEGLVLPQVVSEPEAEAQPEEMAEEGSAAGLETIATSDTQEAEATGSEADQSEAPIDPVAQDSELSLDILQAMQGALTRSHRRVVQQSLRDLGHHTGLIDGLFGLQTKRAISAYQESVGATVTGVLTPAQLDALSE